MKLILLQIIIFSLLVTAFTNFLLAKKAAQSALSINNGLGFAIALEKMNEDGYNFHPTLEKEPTLFDTQKNACKNTSMVLAVLFLAGLLYLYAIRKNTQVNFKILAPFMLAISWLFFIITYQTFNYWRFQKIGEGYIFSGYGFDPFCYFAFIWIIKNGLTISGLIMSQHYQSSQSWVLKTCCILDLVIGNMAILIAYECLDTAWPIFDFRLPNFG